MRAWLFAGLLMGCTPDAPPDSRPPLGGDDTASDTGAVGDSGADDTGDTADTADDTGIEPPEWPSGALVLDHVRVVDASGVREQAAVVIVGDEIWGVTDQGQDWPEDADVRDYAGASVVPGLIDGHVHLFHSGSTWWVGDTLAANLLAYPRWGIVAVADVGSPLAITQVRDRIAAGTLLGPRIWATGPFLTAEGSHPCETTNDRSLCVYVDGDAADAVASLGDVDGFKVALADASFTDWPTPRLDLGDLADIVDAAGDRMVIVHMDEEEDAEDALAAGVSVQGHPVFATDQLSTLDAPVHSTLGAFSGTGALYSGELLSDDLSQTPQAVVDAWTWLAEHPGTWVDGWIEGSTQWEAHSRANVALAIAEGREVVAGTDSGYWLVPHGLGLHRELEALVTLGMSPLDALASATSVPADLYGWSDLGWIDAGYRADLLVIDGKPDEDIAALRDITRVYMGGQIFDADDPWVEPGPDGFCLDDRDCDSGTCDLVDHVCRESCDDLWAYTGECDADTYCIPPDGLDESGGGVCHPGDDCDLYAQDCAPAYYAETCMPVDIDTNRCWPSGSQAEGQACSWTDPAWYCEQGLYCSWVDYTCYELCDPRAPDACAGCTMQTTDGQPWFGLCPQR